MQVYNNNRARTQGRNGFFFSVFVVSLWTRWKRAVVNTALKLPWYNFYDLLLIVTLRRLECGLKFYDFLIDIEEEIEGLLTSIADCVNPEGTAFRRPTLPSIIRIGYSCVSADLQPVCAMGCRSSTSVRDLQPIVGAQKPEPAPDCPTRVASDISSADALCGLGRVRID
jgi:hypothetical protein